MPESWYGGRPLGMPVPLAIALLILFTAAFTALYRFKMSPGAPWWQAFLVGLGLSLAVCAVGWIRGLVAWSARQKEH